MARTLTTAVKNELLTGQIRPIHLIEIGFSTPVYLTDCGFNLSSSISGTSRTYTASPFLVGGSSFEEQVDITKTSLSLSLSGSTEVGLILYNHGTITSDKETIWLGSGNAGAPRSRGVKIYNYDGGIIKSTADKDPIRALYLENSEVINYEGGLIQSAGRYAINTEKGKDLTITNHGTIESTQNSIYCKTCTGVSFENSGTITSGNNTVVINRNNSTFVTDGRTDNTITNSGTITADSNAALTISSSDGTTVTNTGTITGAGRGIMAAEMDNSLITNHGTISATTANTRTLPSNVAVLAIKSIVSAAVYSFAVPAALLIS